MRSRTGLQPLTDGQAFFILRVKLLAACRNGVSFADAWEAATAGVLAVVPPRDLAGWLHTFEATRPDFATAYGRLRARLAVRSHTLA